MYGNGSIVIVTASKLFIPPSSQAYVTDIKRGGNDLSCVSGYFSPVLGVAANSIFHGRPE